MNGGANASSKKTTNVDTVSNILMLIFSTGRSILKEFGGRDK
jgi:hypothetical protein